MKNRTYFAYNKSDNTQKPKQLKFERSDVSKDRKYTQYTGAK